jgi:sulfhydrogenase subunit beta (sulfur reductase)
MVAPAAALPRPVQTLERADLDTLFAALRERGYAVIGPTVRAQAIVYDEIESSADLPAGLTDEQDAGSYRLVRRQDEACFGHQAGPNSWKRFQLPPRVTVWRSRRDPETGEVAVEAPAPAPVRRAFLGARACDLAAMGVLDTVLLDNQHPDAADAARRAETFVVAVQCGEAGGTCFCASMDTGPEVRSGHDLVMTELTDAPAGHVFLLDAATEAGAEVLAALPTRPATADERAAAGEAPARAAAQQTRSLDTDGIRDLLMRNLDHPRFDEVAERCLSCGNCTMVCPTCFCTSAQDTTDLTGLEGERAMVWESCFTAEHSYVHGGSVRQGIRPRYRQWLTHKLATWHDQFGSSGCVGCGRCITWCPVGIDLTEEAAAIRDSDGATKKEEA